MDVVVDVLNLPIPPADADYDVHCLMMSRRSPSYTTSSGGIGRLSTSLLQNTPDSPVSASTMNSWLRSPPIGPVSARIGIAFNPIRAKVRKYATNIRL